MGVPRAPRGPVPRNRGRDSPPRAVRWPRPPLPRAPLRDPPPRPPPQPSPAGFDYGFRTQTARRLNQDLQDGEVPPAGFAVARANFERELLGIRTSVRLRDFAAVRDNLPPSPVIDALFGAHVGFAKGLARLDEALEARGLLPALPPPASERPADLGPGGAGRAGVRERLAQLRLSNDAVYQRDLKRESERKAGGSEPPLFTRAIYFALCVVLDVLYYNRPVPKFWVLETVARMPYFAYTSVLHLYESLGWWRQGAELRKVHQAEEWNELHHLLIMEALGGDQLWLDRFVAQHAAVLYYWILVATYLFSPKASYQFSELVEGHATDTYEEFLEANADLLRELPAPTVAVEYYAGGDLYMFDDFQTERVQGVRRPAVETLYDVFVCIRDDEVEHEKTMVACQDPERIARNIGVKLEEARRTASE